MNLDGDDNDYLVMMMIFVGFGKKQRELLQHFYFRQREKRVAESRIIVA